METEEVVATGGGPMIGVAKRQKPRKPTAKLIAQLERELVRKSDELVHVLNERDEAMNQRDDARCDSDAFRRERDLARDQRDEARRLKSADCEEHQRTERELRGDLRRLQCVFETLSRDYSDLRALNRKNFDRAVRSADVAAVLAKVIVAETDEGPVKTMKRFITSAHQMGVSPEVVAEIQNALSRGFSAQIEVAPFVASKELLAGATAFNREQALADIRDDVLDGFEDYLRGEHPLP